MNTGLMFSSKTDDWATPDDFFAELDSEFHFDLDPCADDFNHKCEKYYTVQNDGLIQDWGGTEYSAIRLTDGKSASGFRKPTRKTENTERWLLCYYLHGRTRNGFTNTFIIMRKSGSFVDG